MITKQEIFDKVYRHFVIEGNPQSLDAAHECAYRGEDGAKCAFGLLIPDKDYNPNMEGCRAIPLIMGNVAFEKFIPHRNLISTLQRWHDRTFGDMSRIQEIAQEFNLQIPT